MTWGYSEPTKKKSDSCNEENKHISDKERMKFCVRDHFVYHLEDIDAVDGDRIREYFIYLDNKIKNLKARVKRLEKK